MKTINNTDEYLGYFLCGLVVVVISVVFYLGIKGRNIEIERQKEQAQIIFDNGKKAGEKNLDILSNPYSQERYPQEHIIWFSGYVEGKE